MATVLSPRCWRVHLIAVLVASLLTLSGLALSGLSLAAPAQAAPAPATAGIQRWSLADNKGDRWAISLFEQPDPDYEGGWRLRLNALGLDQHLDHQRPLDVQDAKGTRWLLANLSKEQVPAGDPAIPAGSAQFDLAGMVPRPGDALPLRISIPLQGKTVQDLMLSPEIVGAISALPGGREG